MQNNILLFKGLSLYGSILFLLCIFNTIHIAGHVLDHVNFKQLAPQQGQGVTIALLDTDEQTVHSAHMRGIIVGTNTAPGIAPHAQVVTYAIGNTPSIHDIYQIGKKIYTDETISILVAPITVIAHASLFSIISQIRWQYKRRTPLYVVRSWSGEQFGWLDTLGTNSFKICTGQPTPFADITDKHAIAASTIRLPDARTRVAPLVGLSGDMVKTLSGNSPATAFFGGFLALLISEFGAFFAPDSIEQVIKWVFKDPTNINKSDPSERSLRRIMYMLHCIRVLSIQNNVKPNLLLSDTKVIASLDRAIKRIIFTHQNLAELIAETINNFKL